jgi:hypothetical protein
VQGNGPAPVTRLFDRETGILDPAPVEEVSGAVRTGRPRQRRDRVKDTKNVLGLPSLFGALSCGCHHLGAQASTISVGGFVPRGYHVFP